MALRSCRPGMRLASSNVFMGSRVTGLAIANGQVRQNWSNASRSTACPLVSTIGSRMSVCVIGQSSSSGGDESEAAGASRPRRRAMAAEAAIKVHSQSADMRGYDEASTVCPLHVPYWYLEMITNPAV